MTSKKLKYIVDHLIHTEKKCKILNDNGLTDESKLFELQIIPILNLVFNLKLRNTNANNSNAAYIDGLDELSNIGFQITTNSTAEKIAKTLRKIENSEMELSRLYFFVLTQKSYKKKFSENNYFKNDYIITTNILVKKIMEDKTLIDSVYQLIDKTDEMLNRNPLYLRFASLQKKYFYPTCNYSNALETLYKNYGVLITGNPGVGKSAISYKLLEEAVSLGFVPIFNVDDYSSKQKQVLLFDDFIDSNDYSSANIEEVKKKLAILEMADKNTLVILNSRTHLISELKKQNPSCYLHQYEKFKVDMKEPNDIEKIVIIKNYLIENFSKSYLLDLFVDNNKGIISIIRHKHFNLRLLSDFSKNTILEKESKLHEKICERMSDTNMIYEEPYNVFSINSQRVLKIIYLFREYDLFSNGKVNIESIILAMKKYFSIDSEDTNLAIKSLLESFIFTYDITSGNNQYISFVNPGVTDFIKKKVDEDSSLIPIFEDANTEQLVNRFSDNKYVQDKKIDKLIEISDEIGTRALIDAASSSKNIELVKIANDRIMQKSRKTFYYNEVDILLPENIPTYINNIGISSIGYINSLNVEIINEVIRGKKYFDTYTIIDEFVKKFKEYWEDEIEDNYMWYNNFEEFSEAYMSPNFDGVYGEVLEGILQSFGYQDYECIARDIIWDKSLEHILDWYDIEEGEIENLEYIYEIFEQVYNEINELEFDLKEYKDYDFDSEKEVEETERDIAIRKFKEEVLKKED